MMDAHLVASKAVRKAGEKVAEKEVRRDGYLVASKAACSGESLAGGMAASKAVTREALRAEH